MLKLTKLRCASILVTFSLVMLCPMLLLAQQKKPTAITKQIKNAIPTDVRGWENSTWGLKVSDFAKLLSNYPNEQNGRIAQARKEPTLVCGKDCILFNYKVEGESFDVFFKFDDKTNGLTEVLISDGNRTHITPGLTIFVAMEDQLLLKYGIYKSKEDKNLAGMIFRSRQWVFPSTVIELKQDYISEDAIHTQIIFRPTNGSDRNKL